MPTIAFAAPLLPGKTEADREALAACASGDRRADKWFREHIKNVHGMDLTEGFPPPEQVLD